MLFNLLVYIQSSFSAVFQFDLEILQSELGVSSVDRLANVLLTSNSAKPLFVDVWTLNCTGTPGTTDTLIFLLWNLDHF